MLILTGKYSKYIYLIGLILIQVIGTKTVQALKCVQCNGSCKEDRSDAPADCPTSGTFTKCFTQIEENGTITRGCLEETNASSCTPDTNCIVTDDSQNNQLVCKTCLGTDSLCSQSNVADSKYSKICDSGISKCIKKISDKLVVRGCANQAEISQCTDKNNCETCENVNCNTGIFPSNRLTCYHCSNEKCNDVTADSVSSKACLLLEANDECYTKGESAATMRRGCKSDTNENQCSTPAEGCVFCNKSNCNNLKYKGPSTLKCYQCSGDLKGSDCFQNQTEANLKTCSQEVLYNQDQYCYTQIIGEKIQRGCLSDNIALSADKCVDGQGGSCYKCNGDSCNGGNVEFTCIRCRSDNDKDCWNNAAGIKGESCQKNSSPSEGCFQGVWNGVAIRGCTVDASPQNQALCAEKNNQNKCEICHEKDCNKKPSSAAKMNLSFALMSIVLIQVILWNFK